jgi:hypothetical protein
MIKVKALTPAALVWMYQNFAPSILATLDGDVVLVPADRIVNHIDIINRDGMGREIVMQMVD